MALNVGENFKTRWLETPVAVRACYERELQHICELLEPATHYDFWVKNHRQLEQQHHIERQKAYADLKQQILDERAYQAELRRQQRQAELEQALTEQRLAEQQRLLKLQQDEQQQQLEQLQELHLYAEQLKQHNEFQSIEKVELAKSMTLVNTLPLASKLEKKYADEIAMRLQMECEQWLEQSLTTLKTVLKQSVHEEIQRITAQISQQNTQPTSQQNTQTASQQNIRNITVKMRKK